MYSSCAKAPASKQCQNWVLLAEGALASYQGKRQTIQDELQFTELADRYEQQQIRNLIDRTPHKLHLSEQQKKALTLLGSVALDFTPVVGDIKSFVEADNAFDYTLAVIGAAGPVGDGAKALIKQAKVLYDAGKVSEAAETISRAKSAANRVAAVDAPVGAVAKPSYVFRGDGRPPTQIFDEGFKASGTNPYVLSHATTNSNSGLVSTSVSPNVGREFAEMLVEGYVYAIRKPPQALDVID